VRLRARLLLWSGIGIVILSSASTAAAVGEVAVRFIEGTTRGLLVLRALNGERLADGELIQRANRDRVESRLFQFADGSLYDQATVFHGAIRRR
jgi:hypothetical protein